MWTCPKCGKVFKNANQNHSCTDKPKTIDEYIEAQDPDKQEDLRLVRSALRNALPEAEEKISWSMPTYWKKHNLIHFAASAHHIGIYPGEGILDQFPEELKGYSTSKGTLRIPYGKVDPDLIAKIAGKCWEREGLS